MPGWGNIFADPVMQGLKPNPELMGLIPGWQAAGCRRVLDAGCGVGRHLLPLLDAGFRVWGADCDAQVLKLLRARLADAAAAGGRRAPGAGRPQPPAFPGRGLRPGGVRQRHQPRRCRHLQGLLPGAGPGPRSPAGTCSSTSPPGNSPRRSGCPRPGSWSPAPWWTSPPRTAPWCITSPPRPNSGSSFPGLPSTGRRPSGPPSRL